jgi:16S rRNA (guanine966-N2)-methyltransferase
MIRILAGLYKGRNILPPPKRAQTRPLTGLAKKSLFDMLAAWMDGARVLDLYCGTGTAGLEAISRGAAHCWFAERDRQVLSRLKRNIADLDARDRATVWAGNVQTRLADWLATLEAPVDVAFVDPPYGAARNWRFDQQIETIFAPLAEHLAGDGRLVLRLPDRAQAPRRLGPLVPERTRQFGEMKLSIWAIDPGGA